MRRSYLVRQHGPRQAFHARLARGLLIAGSVPSGHRKQVVNEPVCELPARLDLTLTLYSTLVEDRSNTPGTDGKTLN